MTTTSMRHPRTASSASDEHLQRQRARAQRHATRTAEQRERWQRAGLTVHGERFTTYFAWKSARGHAVRTRKRWRVDVLDREYPAFFSRLDAETSLAGMEQRREAARQSAVTRTVRYQQRKARYRREDIASGDVELTSYHQFVAEMERAKRGGPHANSDLAAALRTRYRAWYRKYLDAPQRARRRLTHRAQDGKGRMRS